MLKKPSLPNIVIIIPDDYFAGGLQRSALSISTIFQSAGAKVQILAVKLVEGGFASTGHSIVQISPNRKVKLMFWVEFAFRFRQILVDHRGSLMIALGFYPAIFLAILSFGLKISALVGSERVYPPNEELGLAMRIARWLFYHRLNHIVVQSARSAEWFQNKLKIPKANISVIPNVVSRPTLDINPAPVSIIGKDLNCPIIACVGRLTEQKGFDYALRVLSLVKEVYPCVRMMIIGEGPLQPSLRQTASEHDVLDSVSFLAPLPDLREIWKQSSVFLLTSRYEGFPNVLAEAMAHGVPPVAFDCPTGPSDLIRHGENGFLIEVGNFHAAANFVIQLLRYPELRYFVGERAKEVTATFSEEIIAVKWCSLAQTLAVNCERK